MKLYENIASALNKKNINLAIGSMYDYMSMWKEWYAGSVADFHYYSAKLANGTTEKFERKTMNVAKKACEDLTSLLWTEKTQIALKDNESSKKLWSVLDSEKNNFTVNFPRFIEKVLALGNGALVEYQNNGETIIDYINGDVFIPYKYTNTYINGIITISRSTEVENPEKKENTTYYLTHITYHEFENKVYRTKHELYKSKDENELGEEIDISQYYPDLEKEQEKETEFPYFQVLSLNTANNLDMSSPLSVSLFANSIDRLKCIDKKYDSFDNEFDLGKKRILVDSSALKAKATPTSDGKINYVQYFDSQDRVFQAIGEGMENQPVKEIDFTLRVQEHINAINAELDWFADNIGLGAGWFKFDGSSLKTATEVISQDNKAFRTREHHLITIIEVVTSLVNAICDIEGIDNSEIKITPDDSIIIDKNTKKTTDMMEVQQGLMSKKEYLMENKGMTEEQALKELEEINEEKQSNQDLFGFNTSNNNKEDEEKKEDKEE